MNYFKQVAEMLGVKLDEEFKLNSGDDCFQAMYKITKDGLLYNIGTRWEGSSSLGRIISGQLTIVKLPWKPKNGELYWHYSEAWKEGISCDWEGGFNDLLLWKAGNCFRTEEEATAKGKEIMKQIRKEFEEA